MASKVPRDITRPAYKPEAPAAKPHWGRMPRMPPITGPSLPAFPTSSCVRAAALCSRYSMARYVRNRKGINFKVSIKVCSITCSMWISPIPDIMVHAVKSSTLLSHGRTGNCFCYYICPCPLARRCTCNPFASRTIPYLQKLSRTYLSCHSFLGLIAGAQLKSCAMKAQPSAYPYSLHTPSLYVFHPCPHSSRGIVTDHFPSTCTPEVTKSPYRVYLFSSSRGTEKI